MVTTSTFYKGIRAGIRLLFLAAILSSCSGSGGGTPAAAEQKEPVGTTEATSSRPADACALLTEEEARAVLGGPVTKGMSTESMCQYLSASDELSKAGESVSIQLNYGAASEFDTYTSSIEKDLKVKTEAVPGIGDKAVFAEGQLVVLKGQDFMTIIVGKRMSREEQIAAEKAIAQRAIERMAAQ